MRVLARLVLSHSDVLRYCAAYFESHGVFHLFLDASTVGKDEQDIDANKDAYDGDEEFSRDGVGRIDDLLLVLDVLSIVEVDAYLRLVDQVGAHVLQDVLGCDVSAESHAVDGH